MIIEDVKFIETPMADSTQNTGMNDGFFEWLLESAETKTHGRRAELLTEAMILSGVIKDKEALRAILEQHKVGLNAYFDQINFKTFINKFAPQLEENVKAKITKTAVPFAAGIAAGGLGVVLAKKIKEQFKK